MSEESFHRLIESMVRVNTDVRHEAKKTIRRVWWIILATYLGGLVTRVVIPVLVLLVLLRLFGVI